MSETTKRDDGGMTRRFLVVNRATGEVVTDVDAWAEAVEIRDGCEEDSPSHAYLIAEVATPPTPDRAAVREAEVEGWQSSCGFLAISPFCPMCGESRARPALSLSDEEGERLFDALQRIADAEPISEERLARIREGVLQRLFPPTPDRAAVWEADVLSHLYQALDGSPDYTKANLKHVLGLPSNCDAHAIVDALLAVSRPAEARGEPWGYACRVRYTDNVASDWWIRFRTEELPTSHQAEVIPLYAHPAPSGGEGQQPLVFEPEECLMCGVEETVLAPHQTLCSPCTIKMLHPDSPIPPMGEVAPAAPRPETGEVSDVRANVRRDRVQEAAKRGGYFWLPCPICGEHFAGFEWGESLDITATTGEGTCNKVSCIAETKRRNAAREGA